MRVSRPLLRYHGGKWKLAPWIVGLMPKHRIYVEPFCGAASVLIRKPRAYAEIINDKDDELIGLFTVVRDRGAELREALRLTPFSRREFERSYEASVDPLEQARRTVVRSFMGFGSNSHNKATGFRAHSHRSGTTPAMDWKNYPEALTGVIERLRGVTIENRDYAEIIAPHDAPDTLHFVDPPYVAASRDAGGDYRHEMTDSDHQAMAEVLHGLKGMVMLSGYASALYAEIFKGWHCEKKAALADGAKKRTECLWMNPACAARANYTPELIAA